MGDAFSLPPGHGFSRLALEQLKFRDDLLGLLQLFEHPRSRGARRYIMGVDVSDGIGKDRSVVAIHRMGTLEEPEEQVALYVGDAITPVQLAYVVDALGRLYRDDDGYEAMAAVECNNHGLSTQDTLQLHLNYTHFYRWEYLDAGDPQRRYSTKIGWVTTPRTRPMLLDKLYEALTTIDPVTHATDLLIHSAMLRAELADFQTEGALWEASAARGAHDDCVPPETLIRTKRGVVPISEVVVGEEVLTHAGRYQPVLRVGARPADRLYQYTISGRPPLRTTGNHRLLVCLRQPRWGRLHAAGGTAPIRTHGLPEWRAIDDGHALADFSAVAVAPRAVIDRASIALIDYAPATYNVVGDRLVAYTYGGTRENVHQARPPATVAVDEDFCRLLGYYYAEGSRGRHNVAWASHADERALHDWLLSYLRRLGLTPTYRQTSPHGVTISVGAVPLNRFFAEFGSRDQKQFPLWVETLPPDKQRHLLGGWLLGDGSFRGCRGGVRAVTISPHGAAQLAEMCLRVGWPVNVRRAPGQNRHREQWQLTFSSTVTAQIRAAIPPALLACKRMEITYPLVDRTRTRLQHGYLLGHITQVTAQPYTGRVYNLEVAEDHSYVANGTVVHNCVMATAIAHYVAWRLQGGEQEPLAERRARMHAERAARDRVGALAGQPARDWRNTGCTAEEWQAQIDPDEISLEVYDDQRGSPIFIP